MVGLGFANSPAAMPAAGGKHPIFGTNPIAAIFPRRGDAVPLMIDLSLSEVARGKLMVAAKEGRSIPAGWALDAHGNPTTDPKAGLEGSMLPIGAASSPKGAMLALLVELLVTALIGANFGFEGVELLRRRRQPPAHRPDIHRDRPRCACGARRFSRPRRGAGARDARRRRCAPAGCAPRSAAREGANRRPRDRRCAAREPREHVEEFQGSICRIRLAACPTRRQHAGRLNGDIGHAKKRTDAGRARRGKRCPAPPWRRRTTTRRPAPPCATSCHSRPAG